MLNIKSRFGTVLPEFGHAAAILDVHCDRRLGECECFSRDLELLERRLGGGAAGGAGSGSGQNSKQNGGGHPGGKGKNKWGKKAGGAAPNGEGGPPAK